MPARLLSWSRRGRGGAIDSAGRGLTVIALCASAACTLRAADEPIEPPAVILSIAITPEHAVVQPGGSLAFHAVVTGTGPVPQLVRWCVGSESHLSCDGIPGSIIDARGVFTAPPGAPAERSQLRVSARSTAIRSQGEAPSPVVGSAVVEIPAAAIAISPTSADVLLGDEAQFQATLDGTIRPPAWTALVGTVDASGHYRAPARSPIPTDVVRVRSNDLGIEATAQVRLLIPPPVLTATSGPAAPGEILTVYGTGLDAGFGQPAFGGTRVDVLFPDGAGGELPAQASAVFPDRLTVNIPGGAIAGRLRVRLATPDFDPVFSNAVPFERNVRLRVHAARAELAAGETTRVDVAILGGAASSPLTFETDLGTVADGVYAAPAAVSSPTRANVRVCLAGSATCSGTTVTVRPFLVTPSPVVVPAGTTVALSAQRGGAPIAATFAIGSGGGTVTADGVFTAPTTAADAGATWLLASDGSITAPIQVGIGGLAPGLVARAEADVGDPSAPLRAGLPWGAAARSVEIVGTRAYVSAAPNGGAPYFWLDTYDVANPANPAWLGAVEMAGPAELTFAHGRIYAISSTPRPHATHRIEVFDVSGALPVLVASSLQESSTRYFVAPPVVDADFLYELRDPDFVAGVQRVGIRPLADGPLPPARDVVLGPAPDAALPFDDFFGITATARDGRAWRSYRSFGHTALGAWDLTSDPPAFLGSVDVAPLPWSIRAVGPLLLPTFGCYDRRPATPVQVPCAGNQPVTADGTRVVWDTGGDLFTADYADPLAITIGGPVHGAAISARLVGDRLWSAEGAAGVAAYTFAPDGGPRPRATVHVAEPITTIAGYAVANGFLYTAGLGMYVAAWDLASAPPSLASFAPLAAAGQGLEIAGDRLVVGTSAELGAWSLADPARPVQVGTLPLQLTAVAADGPLAFAGTRGGDVVVVDVGTPGAPVELGRVTPLPGVPVSAIAPIGPGRLAAGFARFAPAAPDGGLAFVDVSAPGAPAVTSSVRLGTPVLDLAAAAGVAFVAVPDSLTIWNASDPNAPALLASVALPPLVPQDWGSGPSPTRRVAFSGGLVWLAGDGLLRGYDARIPAWPRLVSEALAPAQPDGIVVDGPRAYTVASFGWNDVFWTEIDLSRPQNVVLTEGPAPSAPPGATIPYGSAAAAPARGSSSPTKSPPESPGPASLRPTAGTSSAPPTRPRTSRPAR